jgi:hypothetical protein
MWAFIVGGIVSRKLRICGMRVVPPTLVLISSISSDVKSDLIIVVQWEKMDRSERLDRLVVFFG